MATPAALQPVRARFEEALSSMTPRDRRLLGGMIIFASILLVLGGFYAGYSHLQGERSRNEDKEQTLIMLKSMKADYESAASQLSGIEGKLKTPADVSAFVEKAAQKTGMTSNLQSVREKGISEDGKLEEKKYQIEISKITLQQLVDFLYELETGDAPIRVRSSKTRTVVVDGKKMLSASLEVSSFRLLEESAAPAEQ